MVTAEPFYAVQGPPGTGKTTLTARAVRRSLMDDPSLRILVSAQSHYALDNLATGILKVLNTDPETLAIRVVSEARKNDIDPAMYPYREGDLEENKVERIQGALTARLSKPGGDSERLRGILQRWRNEVHNYKPEIAERIKRGANLVFVTCGAATESAVGLGERGGDYDWVVVEEAAKAWPTEVLIPMVRGRRWLLVGDQRQLPAYRMDDVQQLLDQCRQGIGELHLSDSATRQFRQVFKFFGQYFKGSPEPPKRARAAESSDWPVRRLDTQFRMEPRIGELVSRAFYDRRLASGIDAEQRVHEHQRFGALRGASVVWLDTHTCAHEAEPAWRNEGEAELVQALITRLGSWKPGDYAQQMQELVVLTPYNQQRKALDQLLGATPDEPRCHTVDSFQGREAETVVVSLVRGSIGPKKDTPGSLLGHLMVPERVNVLFSRARSLLILVGDLAHFRRTSALVDETDPDNNFWREVLTVLDEAGRVVSPPDLQLPDAAGRGRG